MVVDDVKNDNHDKEDKNKQSSASVASKGKALYNEEDKAVVQNAVNYVACEPHKKSLARAGQITSSCIQRTCRLELLSLS